MSFTEDATRVYLQGETLPRQRHVQENKSWAVTCLRSIQTGATITQGVTARSRASPPPPGTSGKLQLYMRYPFPECPA
ncbi:hypothetical protein RRG08_020287 [Elysia crispata]|uniref:Uncharacterized protein n=1 Tax=Elysia crispata TaxID=231223 RepID=A0AAE1EAF9_9GAST|nr:hypothetical protein RRG08_020287 [Elysia crispata]